MEPGRFSAGFWRLVLYLSVIYELALVYLLFQSVDVARQLMTVIDSTLGQPFPDFDSARTCSLYDSNHTNPFHVITNKADIFLFAHFLGWWIQTLVVRDWWLCTVMGVGFELVEYSLEHQVADFRECWWDHWVVDALICNGLGIFFGWKTLHIIHIKPYHWRGMWNVPTYGGNGRPVAGQVTPYCSTHDDSRRYASLKRWCAVCMLITSVQLVQLNTFYMKDLLWIPVNHYLCIGRFLFHFLMGTVSVGELFQYLVERNCTKLGRQSWIYVAVISTECLIVLKYGWNMVTEPLPVHITVCWCVGFVVLISWTVWRFYIRGDVKNGIPDHYIKLTEGKKQM